MVQSKPMLDDGLMQMSAMNLELRFERSADGVMDLSFGVGNGSFCWGDRLFCFSDRSFCLSNF